MEGFLRQSLENMQKSHNEHIYGEYNESEVINLEPLAHIDENPEAIEIHSHGESYHLKLNEFQEAIKKCRNNLVFPSRTTLPYKTHKSPLIYFRVLTSVAGIEDLISNPKTKVVEHIPSNENKYNPETRCIEYFGHNIPVTIHLHDYIISGRKIAVKVDSDGNLVWLTSYEESAFNGWEEKVRLYQNAMDSVHEIMETAKGLKAEKIGENGVFKNLPYDVILGYKVNLSGLSACSSGSGTKRNTVIHAIALDKPLHEFRNLEETNNLPPICGKQQGRHFGMQVFYSQKLSGETLEDTGITCKSCLSRMRKMLKAASK
jgi:hypothetical protein